MSSTDKRKAEGEVEDPTEASKRPRVEENGAGAVVKPSIKLDALERAKKALQRQKELLAARKAASSAAAAPPGPAVGQAAAAVPLPLPTGQEERRAAPATLDLEPEAALEDDSFFDPAIGHRGQRRMDRRRRGGLQFVEEGKFQKMAELGRLRAQYGEGAARQLAARRAAEAAAAAANPSDPNLIPLGERAPAAAPPSPRAPVPAVEWWDVRLLADKTSYGGAAEGEAALRLERITHLVEHPEMKKLRTQRRQAREQEKQELIRQGLLEPPPPKVKISNLSRVLGEEAAADPTAIEAEVRRQMGERAAAHEDRNLARKLTPAEVREKKLRKLVGDSSGDPTTTVAMYKVGDLSKPQLKFKVSCNAQENHMTGVGLAVEDSFTLVIVEGPPKAQRRYEKLMLRRIDWPATGEDDEEMDVDEGGEPKPPNYCRLIWQGTVLKPSFRKFRVENLRNAAAAKAFLGQYELGHYWDLAEAYVVE